MAYLKGFSDGRFFEIINFCGNKKVEMIYHKVEKDLTCIVIKSYTGNYLKEIYNFLDKLQFNDWYDHENKFEIHGNYLIILPKGFKDIEAVKKMTIDKERREKFKKLFY